MTGIDLVREQLRVAGGADSATTRTTSTGPARRSRCASTPRIPTTTSCPPPARSRPIGRPTSPRCAGTAVSRRERRRGRLRPDARQGHRPRPLGPRPQAAWHWPSNACISAVSSPTVTSWLRPCATRRSSPATPPPTSSIARPRRLAGGARYAMAAIVAAMWIQGRNRADDRVWGFARSNFRTGSLPPQSIEFETATDETHRIEYSLRRNGGFTLGSARPCSCTSGPPTTSNSRSMAVACGRQSPSRTASAMSRSDERP